MRHTFDMLARDANKEKSSHVYAKRKIQLVRIMTSDTKSTGKFYSDVVGWTTQEMPFKDWPTVYHLQSR